jgi:beta-glucosidase-like glycosyl hydrolase
MREPAKVTSDPPHARLANAGVRLRVPTVPSQVVSDCDAISDTATHDYILKRFNGSLQLQAQQAIRGGTDVNCGALYGEQNAAAVRSGLLQEAELDVALERLYVKSFQLGIPDITSSHGGPGVPSANPYTRMGPEVVDTPVHRQLALEGALQGQVLLKNQGGSHLPLKKSSCVVPPRCSSGHQLVLGGWSWCPELKSWTTQDQEARADRPARQRLDHLPGRCVAPDCNSGCQLARVGWSWCP